MKEIFGRKLRANNILISVWSKNEGKKNVKEMHAIVIGKDQLYWPWRLMMLVETLFTIHLHNYPKHVMRA